MILGLSQNGRGKTVKLAASSILIASLLVGCADSGMGQKEQVGTGAGALIGGIAGSFLGKGSGKALAIIGGAAIGGLIGNKIGAMLDAEDQKALQARTKQVLLTQPDNAPVAWSSQHSDATATVVTENTRVEQREVKIVRDANVTMTNQIDLIGAKYEAKSTTHIRNSPGTDGEPTGSIAGGSTIWVVGKVHDQPWYMVARGGKTIGYTTSTNLIPAPPKPVQMASAGTQPPNGGKLAQVTSSAPSTTQPYDLDAAAPVRTPADLDALAPTEKADVLVASVTCRNIKTTATAKGQSASSTQTACRSPDGSWDLN
jgi:surface antigen